MSRIELGELSIGVEAIDEQHRELLVLAAELEAGVEQHATADDVNRRFVALIAYIDEHFAAEERLMGEVEYPSREEHRRHHRQFTKDVAMLALSREDEASLRRTARAMARTVTGWIATHVREHDAAFARFYRAGRP